LSTSIERLLKLYAQSSTYSTPGVVNDSWLNGDINDDQGLVWRAKATLKIDSCLDRARLKHKFGAEHL